MNERSVRRQFITDLASEAVDRHLHPPKDPKDNSPVELYEEYSALAKAKARMNDQPVPTPEFVTEHSYAVNKDVVQQAMQGDLRDSPLFNNKEIINSLTYSARSRGLTIDDVRSAFAEVQKHIALTADVSVRELYRQDLFTATRDGSKNVFRWDWKKLIGLRLSEATAMIGLGQASEIREVRKDLTEQRRDRSGEIMSSRELLELSDDEREQAIQNSHFYVEELIEAAFEKQAMQRKLRNYAELGGPQLRKLLQRFDESGMDVEQFQSHISLEVGVKRIVQQMQLGRGIEVPSATDRSGFEIIHVNDAYTEQAVRGHLAYLLKTEITNLAQMNRLELVRAKPVYDDGTPQAAHEKVKNFSRRLMLSGTFWSIAMRTGSRLGVAGMGAGVLLEGTTGIAAAAGLGAVGAAVREVFNEKKRIDLRRIDVAVGAQRVSEHLVRPAEDISNQLGKAAAQLRQATTIEQLTLAAKKLYAIVADTQSRLNPPQYNSKISPQDYIAFGKDNRFKAQNQMIQNLGDAIDLIHQSLKRIPIAHAVRTRREMSNIGSLAIQKQAAREAELFAELHSTVRNRIGRYIQAMTVGAAFAGAATAAFEGVTWLFHKAFGPEPSGVEPSFNVDVEATAGTLPEQTIQLGGESVRCVIRPDSTLQFLYEDGRMFNYLRLPDGLDVSHLRLEVGADGHTLNVFDLQSDTLVEQVSVHIRPVLEGEFVQSVPESTPNLFPGLPAEIETAQGVIKTTIDEAGLMHVFQSVGDKDVPVMNPIELFTTEVRDYMGKLDDPAQFVIYQVTETGTDGNVSTIVEVRSVFNLDKVVTTIAIDKDIISETASGNGPATFGEQLRVFSQAVKNNSESATAPSAPVLARPHLGNYKPVSLEDLSMHAGEKFLEVSLLPESYKGLILTDIGSIIVAENIAQPSTRVGWKNRLGKGKRYHDRYAAATVGESIDHAHDIKAQATEFLVADRIRYYERTMTPEYIKNVEGLIKRITDIGLDILSPTQQQALVRDQVGERIIKYHRQLQQMKAECDGSRDKNNLRAIMPDHAREGVVKQIDELFDRFVVGRQLEKYYAAILRGSRHFLAQLQTDFTIHANDAGSTHERRVKEYNTDLQNLIEFEAGFRSMFPDKEGRLVVPSNHNGILAFHTEMQQLGHEISNDLLVMDMEAMFSTPSIRAYVFEALEKCGAITKDTDNKITIRIQNIVSNLMKALNTKIAAEGWKPGEYTIAMENIGIVGSYLIFNAKHKANIDTMIANLTHDRTGVAVFDFASGLLAKDLSKESQNRINRIPPLTEDNFSSIHDIETKDAREIVRLGITPADFYRSPVTPVVLPSAPRPVPKSTTATATPQPAAAAAKPAAARPDPVVAPTPTESAPTPTKPTPVEGIPADPDPLDSFDDEILE